MTIYFLLQGHEVSVLHRLRSDELWHFHAGAPLHIVELTPAGAPCASTDSDWASGRARGRRR